MSDLLDALLHSKELQVVFSMLLTAIAYTVIMYIVVKKLRHRKKDEQEKIFDMARFRNCSEYDIFTEAAEKWNIPQDAIKEDFKKYILFNDIPHYVRDYIRTLEDTAR